MSANVTHLAAAMAQLGAFTEGRSSAAEDLNTAAGTVWDGIRRMGEEGKHIRARLALAGARLDPDAHVIEVVHDDAAPCPGVDQEAAHRIAAAFDLLHVGFLIHDDVIDEDPIRRGIPTVHARAPREFQRPGVTLRLPTDQATRRFGESIAIVAGDSAITGAYRMVIDSGAEPRALVDILRVMDDAVAATALGEILDIEYSVASSADITSDDVALASSLKTSAYTFEAPLLAGALLAGADDAELAVLGAIGERLGSAFQILDDLDGVFGSTDQTGKAEGGDLLEGRRTMVLEFARESALWPRIEAAAGEAVPDVPLMRELIARSGAPERAGDVVLRKVGRVRELMGELPHPVTGAVIGRACESFEHRVERIQGVA
ncbi:polyprenyl synthetase family protein [Rothia sp. AR01]|uniref:Polyprenyl synthetase family protein n=1 Tax=Rothia santali TaxID=2949643 RepID=A0A9X2HIS9_9MICC|nr:polyprenyl synthetase family protein [Rothia santali]MCP3425613.1 polyprenyl synthetase family protein [Rothia santali]